MRALVTGGSGFLGKYLVKELLKEGHEVVVYDLAISEEQKKKATKDLRVRCIMGDILDFPQLRQAVEGCDVVFHTAAIADLDKARTIPRKTMEVNVLGTTNCLEAARLAGVKRFVFASSVYTAGKWGSFYRVSKQAGESLCKTYHDEYGLNYTIVRYGSLYGGDSNHWNFIYNVCRALLTSKEFTYISSKESVREYIHIFDASRETVRISGDPLFINKVALITGHQRMRVEEIFAMIKEILGKDVVIRYTPAEEHKHYVITPYSFETDVPVRINLPTYVDIHEGILDCLKTVKEDLEREAGPKKITEKNDKS